MIRLVVAGAILGVLALVCGCASKSEDSTRLVNQALERASQNDWQGAKSKLALAITADPNNAAAYHTRAAIFCKEGDIDSALPDFERAVDLEKNNAAWRYELAGKYWELYQASLEGVARDDLLPKINEHASRAIEINATVADYFLLRARCRKALLEFKGAAQDYRKTIDLDPLRVDAYLELGRLYGLMWKVFYREDLFGLAEETLLAAERLGEIPDLSAEGQSKLPEMLFELGELYSFRSTVESDDGAQRGFREKAIAKFLAIEEDYDDRATLKRHLAEIFQLNGDIPKACTAAREAMQGIVGNDTQSEMLREYVRNLEQEVCVTSTGYDPNR
jgi:tetratricopeptide (TPR) repeat protein